MMKLIRRFRKRSEDEVEYMIPQIRINRLEERIYVPEPIDPAIEIKEKTRDIVNQIEKQLEDIKWLRTEIPVCSCHG